MPGLILLTVFTGNRLDRLARAFGPGVDIRVVRDLKGLESQEIDTATSLVSFGTGVIVPRTILATLSRPAYNLHAASTAFPGRDPHHHAIYRGVTDYGATLHLMTERVDEGGIVAQELFPVPDRIRPGALLELANEAGFRILERLGPRLLDDVPMASVQGLSWSPRKSRRSDLARMSSLTPLITPIEFEKRFHAFDGEVHDNLTVELHGRKFRIDKTSTTGPAPTVLADLARDTARNFLDVVQALQAQGRELAFYALPQAERAVVIRHDVLYSLDFAHALAQYEASREVPAVFFLQVGSPFYSVVEPRMQRLIRNICSAGHRIGLLFDPEGIGARTTPDVAALRLQRDILEAVTRVPVTQFCTYSRPESNSFASTDWVEGMLDVDGAEIEAGYECWPDRDWRQVRLPDHSDLSPRRPLQILCRPDRLASGEAGYSAWVERVALERARAVWQDFEESRKEL